MNGCFVYNKIARNVRCCYRSYGECEVNVDVKRRFFISAQMQTSYSKTFSYKSIFEIDRKLIWEKLKLQFNEKLAIFGEILTEQCNFVASQRLRRMNQMWNLYSHLYSESAIKQIVSQIAKNLRSQKRPFSILFGAALFSWERDRITDEEVENCISELDRYQSADDYSNNSINGQNLLSKLVDEGWEAVIQKEHVQVWRKPFPKSYLYEYKIMGTFYDVPARTFFTVQKDIEYRKKWDKLVIKLDVIDKDPNADCEVMHWVMHYPYPMYSREYVYVRRAVVSPKTNTMVLVSRAIDHPAVPENNKYVRVTQYTSRMVIRPHKTYDDNGFDYVLTYFDDPKAAFPAPAYNWMASSGVPDFVEKLHDAARELHRQEKKNKSSLQVSKSTDTCTSGNMEYIYM